MGAMFCYYKAKADLNEGVTKDAYRIWRDEIQMIDQI